MPATAMGRVDLADDLYGGEELAGGRFRLSNPAYSLMSLPVPAAKR
ncbi:hypothetical protein [Ruegeria sp. Ofav3-42]|nr:hypothetical protein [Ruegeria sp. Ofav3-42]MCG7522382.1 hypothetical protein [Ruegeria sp. Ofav3-42]